MRQYDMGRWRWNRESEAAEAFARGLVGYIDSNDELALIDDADQFTAQFRQPFVISAQTAAADERVSAWGPRSFGVEVVAGTGGFTEGDEVVVEASTGRVLGIKTNGLDQDPLPYTGTWCLGYALTTQTTAGSFGWIDFAPFMFGRDAIVYESVNEAGGVDRGQVVKLASAEVSLINEADQAAAQLITPFGIVLEDAADGATATIARGGIVPLEAGANALDANDFWAAEDGGDIITEDDVTIADGDWYGGRIILAAAADALGAGTFEPWQQQLA